MASATALQERMAGHVPAIRMAALTMIGSAGLTFSPPAAAQMDPATRGQLQAVHRSLVTAEENLGVAIRDKDFPRAKSANEILSSLSSSTNKQNLPADPCLQALESLRGVAVAVAFSVHPVTTGDLDSMKREELRYSEKMRPQADVLNRWYAEYSGTYKDTVLACEREIDAGPTARFLPSQLTQK